MIDDESERWGSLSPVSNTEDDSGNLVKIWLYSRSVYFLTVVKYLGRDMFCLGPS